MLGMKQGGSPQVPWKALPRLVFRELEISSSRSPRGGEGHSAASVSSVLVKDQHPLLTRAQQRTLKPNW